MDGERLRQERRLKGGERIQVGPLVFGVSIVRFLSEKDATPFPGRPLPPEAIEEDAASILLVSKDQEAPEKSVEFSSDYLVGDAATLGSPLPPEAIEEDAASILLVTRDHERRDKSVEFSPDDLEGDAATPAQIAEAERLIRWRGLS